MTAGSPGDHEVRPDDAVDGPVVARWPVDEVPAWAPPPPRRPSRRPSTAQFVVTGIWASLNLVGGLFFLPFALWIAGTCPSTDASGCGGAGSVLAFGPTLGAVVGFVLWCVGVRRRRVSGGLGWAWGGVAVGFLGGVILAVAMSG